MYKNNAEGSSRRARRTILKKNMGNKRSDWDKPFFALPSYMNKYYQKVKGPKTPEQYLEDFATDLRDIVSSPYEEELFDTFPDGKYKGQEIASFCHDFATMSYVLWTLFCRRKYKKLIRSILHHSDKARLLTRDGETLNRFIRSNGLDWDSFYLFYIRESRK